MILRRVPLSLKFIVLSILISIVLGFFIWNFFSDVFDREVKKILKGNLEDQVIQIENILRNYEFNVNEYHNFRKKMIEKNLLNTAEDFFITAAALYEEVKKKKITEDKAKEVLFRLLGEKKIGKKGYIYILDNHGTVLFHPKKELVGTNQNIKDKKYDFIREQIRYAVINGDKTFIEYEWKNPDDANWRPKVLGQVYFKPWNWIISVSGYKIDFDSIIDPFYEKAFFEELKKQILNLKIGKNGYPIIVLNKESVIKDIENNVIDKKNKGQILIHPDFNIQGKYLQEISSELPAQVFQNNKGFITYTDQGKEKIAVYKTYSSLNWVLIASVSSDEYLYENKMNVLGVILKIIIFSLGINLILNVLFFYFNVSRTVKKVRIKFDSIAKGDLSFSKKNPYTQDNIGKMILSINLMAQKLETIIGSILESAQEISKSIEEVSVGNMELSERTEKQSVALEELSSSLEEFTMSVNSNTKNSEKANKLSQEAKLSAENGGEIISSAVDLMKEIQKSSSEIENIINIIEEIAFQTNLLALNAAVEAARAGEYGKGFAVVAMEIRSLAKNTRVFSKRVYELIKKTLAQVEEESALVYQSGEALQTIIDIVTETTTSISEVSAGSEEQKRGVEEINRAILQLQEINDQNSQLAEQNSANSEEMVGKTAILKQAVSFFHLEQSLIKKKETNRTTEKIQEDRLLKNVKVDKIIDIDKKIEINENEFEEF
ncbi:MAG TPA: hypothetical protein DHW82_05145 [Spirochaetia bacterium]|nr:MAG: hypothetical protein A2Y41_09510 [Spirochaetes bacterium GWB1_36_13]HCL56378.1 hypothetical protein [Spirochaetia bacterium]